MLMKIDASIIAKFTSLHSMQPITLQVAGKVTRYDMYMHGPIKGKLLRNVEINSIQRINEFDTKFHEN
jgi:hypothetical protein